jgi:hypothetical protein
VKTIANPVHGDNKTPCLQGLKLAERFLLITTVKVIEMARLPAYLAHRVYSNDDLSQRLASTLYF